MRCHSHYAALHAHVALARYTSSPKISRLWASSHGWFRPACAPLVETRKFQFNEEVIYMKKSISRIIGVIMLIVAIVFIMFALNHPEKSFPWNNTITWLLYGVYFLVAVVLLIAPKIKKWEIPVWWSDKFQFLKLRNRYLLGKNTISYVYAITREEWKKMKENWVNFSTNINAQTAFLIKSALINWTIRGYIQYELCSWLYRWF